MPVAHSYIRMSRPEQMRGDSLRRQTEAAKAWAAKRGIAIDYTLRDIGVSAYRGKNRTSGALAADLDMVEIGSVERGSYRTYRVVPRRGETVPAHEISLLDEAPVVLDYEDIAMLESTVDVPNTPLSASWGKRPHPDTRDSRQDCAGEAVADTASCASASVSVRTKKPIGGGVRPRRRNPYSNKKGSKRGEN